MNDEEEEEAALNEDRKVIYTKVLVTEVTDEAKFYTCNVSYGNALEKLMDNLREEFITGKKRAQVWKKFKKFVKALEICNFGTGTLEVGTWYLPGTLALIELWNSGYQSGTLELVEL